MPERGDNHERLAARFERENAAAVEAFELGRRLAEAGRGMRHQAPGRQGARLNPIQTALLHPTETGAGTQGLRGRVITEGMTPTLPAKQRGAGGATAPPELRGFIGAAAPAQRRGAPVANPVPVSQGRGVVERPLRKARPIPAGEVIARRTARWQRKEAIAFLYLAGLEEEMEELRAIEVRLRIGRDRDLCHAAFSARMLLQGVADRLFPARAEPWIDSQNETRDVGAEKVLNRLSAYVEQHLWPSLETADRRAFQGELDGLMRWAGAGAHGARNRRESDLAFTRLLSVLTALATAYAQAGMARAA